MDFLQMDYTVVVEEIVDIVVGMMDILVVGDTVDIVVLGDIVVVEDNTMSEVGMVNMVVMDIVDIVEDMKGMVVDIVEMTLYRLSNYTLFLIVRRKE
jgi:hypothetical protein